MKEISPAHEELENLLIPQVTMVIILWTGASVPSLSWAAETGPVYVALNDPVLLNIPGYPNAEKDQVTWRDGNGVLMGKFKTSSAYDQTMGCECELFRNGSLYLKRLDTVGDKTYRVEVFNQSGKQISFYSITVTLIKSVAAPVLSYTCGGKQIRLRCEVSEEDNPDEMKMMWNNSLLIQSTKSKSLGKNVSLESHGNVTCTVRNRVSENTDTKSINCHKANGMEWFMVAAIAAGGVAFLIFIILLSYFVSRSRCQNPRICEFDDSVSYENNISLQEQQLPDPPSLPDTQTLIQPPAQTQSHSPGTKPSAPKGHPKIHDQKPSKKGARCKQNGATVEKQAPQHQKQQNLSKSERNPSSTNVPSTHPPRPQPRIKSRPAHQHQ
ncbi:T-cell surface antigen CD2-like isoform X2 [Xenopus laevis]|uniref:Ig-like domain-containing protein n=2 Tax=Xenopus laevis TaxID=8355 RepID=A0A974DKB4_XENLA|nr:T-cell surface antigen CD2-like isoform X2 [Xenopus laevis]OCT93519.1 hypothetical protein XELAEV_18011197mg [Xenopus laevis]